MTGSIPETAKAWFLAAHPVGSIYMSTSPASPATLYGGTWERWGRGRVPVGVDETDNDFSGPSVEGGEKQHYLSLTEMPIHTHTMKTLPDETTQPEWLPPNQVFLYRYVDGVQTTYYEASLHGAGGNSAHNNLQPYVTCYMWRRTA